MYVRGTCKLVYGPNMGQIYIMIIKGMNHYQLVLITCVFQYF